MRNKKIIMDSMKYLTVEIRYVFNDGNFSKWEFWDNFSNFDKVMINVENQFGILQEVDDWEYERIWEPVENDRIQFRIKCHFVDDIEDFVLDKAEEIADKHLGFVYN